MVMFAIELSFCINSKSDTSQSSKLPKSGFATKSPMVVTEFQLLFETVM